jgi:hypothetical protein
VRCHPKLRRARLALILAALAVPGCAERAWDLEQLERRHPALKALEGHRLAEVRPYYLPLGGRLTLFLCRWSDGARVPVSLPPDATPDERRQLEAALAAWERAGLGVRFERRSQLSGAGIELRLFHDRITHASGTVTDCAVEPDGLEAGVDDPLPARIVFASIHLAHGDPRLTGTAVHELGHALGFQGHPRSGDTAMLEGVRNARHTGERAGGGEAFHDAAVNALYAVPSGSVLVQRPLPAGRTTAVDRLLAIGRREGWLGPRLRVGNTEGRVAWYDRDGRRIGVRLTGLAPALREPARLRIEPSDAARDVLERAR